MYQNDNPVAGPLQIRALKHLWENGGATVHEVVDAMNAEPGKPKLAYTTILTVLRNLARRRIVTTTKTGRSHVFAPAVSRDEYRANVARWLVAEQFSGDAKAAASAVAAVR
jgi:predicted transcriptional regulator